MAHFVKCCPCKKNSKTNPNKKCSLSKECADKQQIPEKSKWLNMFVLEYLIYLKYSYSQKRNFYNYCQFHLHIDTKYKSFFFFLPQLWGALYTLFKSE